MSQYKFLNDNDYDNKSSKFHKGLDYLTEKHGLTIIQVSFDDTVKKDNIIRLQENSIKHYPVLVQEDILKLFASIWAN